MDVPDAIEFSCGQCSTSASAKAVLQERGRCRKCHGELWRVQVTYHVVDVERSSLGETAALNALGIGLAITTGTGFVAGRGGQGERRTETASYLDVPGDEIVSIMKMPGKGKERAAALLQRLQQREAQAHHQRLAERGAKPCVHCGALAVPFPTKPWTMAGACSKLCCAKMMNAERYADVEAEVIAKFGGKAEDNDAKIKAKKLKASVAVRCQCGHEFMAPKMYVGAQRPCPHCKTLNTVQAE